MRWVYPSALLSPTAWYAPASTSAGSMRQVDACPCCSPILCVSAQRASAHTFTRTMRGVTFDAHVVPSAEHLNMELCPFWVVAQPWQGAGLPCMTS